MAPAAKSAAAEDPAAELPYSSGGFGVGAAAEAPSAEAAAEAPAAEAPSAKAAAEAPAAETAAEAPAAEAHPASDIYIPPFGKNRLVLFFMCL